MNYRNHFVLAARIVGLLIALSGLQTLLTLIFILFSGGADAFLIVYFLTVGLFDLLLGAYLLRGAPFIVRFAFGRDGEDVKIDLP
jgi:hypothetical protein